MFGQHVVSKRGVNKYKRPKFIIGAFIIIAAVLVLAYSHLALLWISNHAQTVRVTALLPAGAGAALQQQVASYPAQQRPTGRKSQPGTITVPVVGSPEIWAVGPQHGPQQQQLLMLLDAGALAQLKSLCGRCLYRTLTSYVHAHDFGHVTVVLTGDIPAMWLRDSAVQMASYFPRVSRRPAIRQLLEGTIRAQSYFILQDPWANAYNPKYIHPSKLGKYDRQLGRGGWVWTRNFELDSIAYFFNLLWNYHQTPSIWRPAVLLIEPLVHDAVVTLLKLLEVEQLHEQQSPYRYSELPRQGLGPPSNYTGMVWSAFRASDDQQKYSFNVPDNMYLWGSLNHLAKLNSAVWQDSYVAATTKRLMIDVHAGIQQHGTIEVSPGIRIYAYEVDGLGNSMHDFDDPNLPSLLALPLLGYEVFDASVYATTRARILSPANPYFYSGSQLHGLGSPHTAHQHVWPLATSVEALTSNSTTQQAELLKMMLKMAYGNGLMHESVHVDNLSSFTRPEFGWANAMLVVAVETLLGVDCDAEAEVHRLAGIANRELQEPHMPANNGKDVAQYYEQLEASIMHE